MMGLNPRGRGRGRGGKGYFQVKSWGETGMMSQNAISPTGHNSIFHPGGSQAFGEPSGFNNNPLRPTCEKFLPRNINREQMTKGNAPQLLGTDLAKPHFTKATKYENKRQRCLETWRKTKHNENWNKYKVLARGNNLSVYNHYCETCDKSFRTQEDLLLHEADHETCNRDGCEFTAHPKIIAKHIKMQHESGLYTRIGNLYTEEDIATWIEERKKRYPTRKVIEEKKVLEQEKINRGERIKDDNSKFNKSFNKRNRNGWRKNLEKQTHRSTKNRSRRKKQTSLLQKHLEEEQAQDFRKGVPAFMGIGNTNEQQFPEKNEYNISDDEWVTECETPNFSKVPLNSSLGLLAEFYNSDEDNLSQEPQHEIIAENISADEGSGPEEVKTVSIKKSLLEEKSNEKKVYLKRKFMEKKEMTKSKRGNTCNEFSAENKSLTLLEKLLKNEIRHERNVILQCIHYIVNHNFFKT